MSLTEAALKKMSKDEVIALTLEYQAKFNSTVASIADLKSDFRRLESELSISRYRYMKGKNLTSLGINKPIYINDSLCTYYKKLWAKCKKLRDNQVIHAFWISNGSIKLKVSETGNVHTVTHDVDLEVLFPGNSLIEDVRRM